MIESATTVLLFVHRKERYIKGKTFSFIMHGQGLMVIHVWRLLTWPDGDRTGPKVQSDWRRHARRRASSLTAHRYLHMIRDIRRSSPQPCTMMPSCTFRPMIAHCVRGLQRDRWRWWLATFSLMRLLSKGFQPLNAAVVHALNDSQRALGSQMLWQLLRCEGVSALVSLVSCICALDRSERTVLVYVLLLLLRLHD